MEKTPNERTSITFKNKAFYLLCRKFVSPKNTGFVKSQPDFHIAYKIRKQKPESDIGIKLKTQLLLKTAEKE